ncbi:MAG: hypothetical protein JSR19_05840 [Proteobacteria bacterium]|nr:hypothetical protein [Pseudomonadota bacterium]HQR04697.1 hypothetical protein [Rhodocyclaceae bacterium]
MSMPLEPLMTPQAREAYLKADEAWEKAQDERMENVKLPPEQQTKLDQFQGD